MVRILATADWHLGKAFSGVGVGANRFREQLFLTAEHIINEVSSDFDIILILGDTFDRLDADWKLIVRVAELLRSCDKPIHIITGNHDPWSSGVLKSLENELEDAGHVVIHSEQQPYLIEALGVTLYPGVLHQKDDLSDRTSWIPVREKDDGVRIGMFHEEIDILPNGSFNSKIASEYDLDIVILGDQHGPSEDWEDSRLFNSQQSAERRLWYTGSHEAQNISQNWQGRVLSIDAELGSEPIVNPIAVGSLRFIDIDDFEFDEDMEEPLALLNERLGEIEGDPELTFVRLELAGEAIPETLDALDDELAKFVESWPLSEVNKGQLAVLIDLKNTDADANLRVIEAELENMNLDPEVLARSVVLLRRYHRKLA